MRLLTLAPSHRICSSTLGQTYIDQIFDSGQVVLECLSVPQRLDLFGLSFDLSLPATTAYRHKSNQILAWELQWSQKERKQGNRNFTTTLHLMPTTNLSADNMRSMPIIYSIALGEKKCLLCAAPGKVLCGQESYKKRLPKLKAAPVGGHSYQRAGLALLKRFCLHLPINSSIVLSCNDSFKLSHAAPLPLRLNVL